MFMNTHHKPKLIKAIQPTAKQLIIMRILISIGILSISIFLYWFFSEERIGYPLLYWPLTFVLMFKFLRTLHEWYHYFHISVPTTPELKKIL